MNFLSELKEAKASGLRPAEEIRQTQWDITAGKYVTTVKRADESTVQVVESQQEIGVVKLLPRKFDFATNIWKLSSSDSSSFEGDLPPNDDNGLKFVSYNVWFHDINWQARAVALFDTIRAENPDVICLQEVTTRLLSVLRENDWIRRNYFICDSTLSTNSRYGVFMLSRFPFLSCRLFEFESQMGRKLLLSEISIPNPSTGGTHSIAVGTVHLESLSHSSTRMAQLSKVVETLRLHRYNNLDAVIMGDFNFNYQSEENVHLNSFMDENSSEKYFVDVWEHLVGYSDVDACTSRRGLLIDRFIAKSSNHLLRPVEISRIGTVPFTAEVPPEEKIKAHDEEDLRDCMFPSDHDGLAIRFALI